MTASGDPDAWKRERARRPILNPKVIVQAMDVKKAKVHQYLREARIILRQAFNQGGKLFLTDRRLVFCPHWVDGATGGKTWDASRSDVAAVGPAPKGGKRGGLRDRLRIELTNGGEQLFVVNRLADVVSRLEAARQEDGNARTDSTTVTE